ncbi:MAG: energy-coupling factor transporter transmembrane protein EcfT [Thermoplasmata archaeon]|nr:MAG: energy-coupling factor transporter transmembrane protein EcfT [Thermoplasmata archaeon]
MLPFYKDRDTPVHRLHPAAKMATVLAVVLAALVLTHPNYLLALLAGTVILARAGRVLREWWSFMRLFAIIALMVVVINTLVSSQGETTFWEGPYIWGFGQLSISLEGVVYGTVMALRLYVVVAAFTIVSLTVHPDEFTQLLARFAYRSGLAVSLSTRFYPAVVRDASAIMDAQRSRGLDLDSGGRVARIRHRMPVIMPLFHSSLERAVGTAEAMEARGFGSAERTRWQRRSWRAGDVVAMASSSIIAMMAIVLSLWGDGFAVYYPTIQLEAGPTTLVWQMVMVTLMALPVLIGRGGDNDGRR